VLYVDLHPETKALLARWGGGMQLQNLQSHRLRRTRPSALATHLIAASRACHLRSPAALQVGQLAPPSAPPPEAPATPRSVPTQWGPELGSKRQFVVLPAFPVADSKTKILRVASARSASAVLGNCMRIRAALMRPRGATKRAINPAHSGVGRSGFRGPVGQGRATKSPGVGRTSCSSGQQPFSEMHTKP
jgi:hypothetical protein